MFLRTLVAAGTAAVLSAPVAASSLHLIGESEFGDDINISFDDSNGNFKLDLSEFVSYTSNSSFYDLFPDLVSIGSGPTISPYAVAGSVPGASRDAGAFVDFWFGTGTSTGIGPIAGVWTWRIEPATPVPLPAGLPLVLTGLAGLAGLRMHKKRKARG